MNPRSYRTFQALVLALLAIYLLERIGDGRILLYINRRYVILAMGAAVLLMVAAQAVLRSRKETSLSTQRMVSPVSARRLTLKVHRSEPLQALRSSPSWTGRTRRRPALRSLARIYTPVHRTAAVPRSMETSDPVQHEHPAEGRKGWVLWMMALPLLIGILIPSRPLNAGAASVRGLNTSSALTSQQSEAALSLSVPPQQRTVLDWIRVFSGAKDPGVYTGQPADVTGFVYHDIRLRQGEFMTARFSVTCCVADAIAIGALVEWSEAAGLPDNRWVRVRGSIEVGEVDGQKVPLIRAASVETVPEPEQPYIFP